MAKGPTITTIASGYYSRTALNDNFENIDTAFDNTLSLDGSTPNSLGADLDLNSNDIINAATINTSILKIGGTAVTASNAVDAHTEYKYAFKTVADLLADTRTLTTYYTVGDYVLAGGFAYVVVASGGDVTTAGGVELDVLVSQNGYNVKAFGAVGDNTTNDVLAIQAAIDASVAGDAGVFFPNATYLIDAALLINEASSVELKAESYRGATIRKSGNVVDANYGVDALLIIRNTGASYGYSHHVDGIKFDASTSANAYGIYAPQISQCVFENGSITGAVIGFYSSDAWLCSIRNMNIACGDTSNPTTSIPAGSIGISIVSGTSLFLQNVWCRICETGYKFSTNLAYSSMSSCACDYFSGAAYNFTGSTLTMSGCSAESTVGTAAKLFTLNNSRVTVGGMATFNLGCSIFFDLFLAEMHVAASNIAETTNAAAGTTFKSIGGSLLSYEGRVFPTNTATVYDVDDTSTLSVKTAAGGSDYHVSLAGTQAVGSIPDEEGNVKPSGGIVLKSGKYLYATDPSGNEDIMLIKSISDAGVELRNTDTAGVFLYNGGARRVECNNSNFRPVTDNAYGLGSSGNRFNNGWIGQVFTGGGTVKVTSGAGSPEGVLTANIGSFYGRSDGGAGTSLYVKESGTGNTGWVAK